MTQKRVAAAEMRSFMTLTWIFKDTKEIFTWISKLR
jgi:hypothetical protein